MTKAAKATRQVFTRIPKVVLRDTWEQKVSVFRINHKKHMHCAPTADHNHGEKLDQGMLRYMPYREALSFPLKKILLQSFRFPPLSQFSKILNLCLWNKATVNPTKTASKCQVLNTLYKYSSINFV